MLRAKVLDFEQLIQITAAPTQVVAAFFDPHALTSWWHAARSVTSPRPLGVYAVEWESTSFHDEILGPLGGVFHGTVIEFHNGRDFFIADAYWLPPESEAVGPMSLQVTCRVAGPGTELYLRQRSSERGERWKRYSELVAPGWIDALAALKRYLERGGEPRLPPRGRFRY